MCILSHCLVSLLPERVSVPSSQKMYLSSIEVDGERKSLYKTREESAMRAVSRSKLVRQRYSIPFICTMARSLGAHAALAGITHAKPVSTCRPSKPNLIYPPACTAVAGLAAPSCVQGAPGNGSVCEGANQPASLLG